MMAYDFNADEMFNLAIRIEANGARFYRKAAALQADSENKEMLERLAKMEDNHQLVFEKMQQQLSDAQKTSTVFDPMDESAQYLEAMADTHRGEGDPTAADNLTGRESMADIIDIAIGLEKESVLFYLGLKDLVPPDLGQEKLDEIIAQERKHIIQLTTIRRKL